MATNSAAITGAAIDAQLWQSGAASPKLGGPAIELDFLRGIHNPISLKMLQIWLQSLTGNHIRLTSVWLDKYGNVVPKNFPIGQAYNYQELADFAIFVRDAKNPSTDEWMWLLQGKVTPSPLAPLPANQSTAREIHLFETMPEFTWYGKHTLGYKFKLKKDFSGPMQDYKHWSFLCFEADTATAKQPQFISVRWPGTLSGATKETSFCDELAEIVRNFSRANPPNSIFGAALGLRNQNWDDLATQILYRAAVQPKTGHASPIRKKQSDVLITALHAENNSTGVAVSKAGRAYSASRHIEFWHSNYRGFDLSAEMRAYGFDAHAISTGFLNNNLATINTTEKMIERLESKRRESNDWDRNGGQQGGGPSTPNGAGDDDGEGGGGGARLVLFVDVFPGE